MFSCILRKHEGTRCKKKNLHLQHPSATKKAWHCAVFIVLQLMTVAPFGVEGIGVNWGNQAAQTLHPKTIAQLLQDNHIDKVKLFESDPWTVDYFANTGIEVMLAIPNDMLESLADDYDNAKEWVEKNLTKAQNKGVDIRYVAVGNEPFLKSYEGANLKTTFPALQNIQKAIKEAGLADQVKVTIPQNADVYESSSTVPSDGNFRSDIRDIMVKIVKYFDQHNSPFLVNIYPFLSLALSPDFPEEFAFFDGGGKPIQDKGKTYNNMFDANLDTLVWSLKKAGISNPHIMVGEVGWPTDGHAKATVELAHKFYRGFMRKVANGQGTPLYSKKLEYYLFSLTDENQKSIAPGDFERHWGIFQYDGKPKFPIDFKGNSNEQMPVAAKGVKYLESKWCVLNSDIKIMDGVEEQVKYACSLGDCTALDYNGSCGTLGTTGRASYAFNSYYQIQHQDVRACDFGGKARLVNHNASRNGCLFPIGLEIAGGWKLGVNSVFVALSLFLALF